MLSRLPAAIRRLPLIPAAVQSFSRHIVPSHCAMATLKRKANGTLPSSPVDPKKQKQGSLTSFFGAPKPVSTPAANKSTTSNGTATTTSPAPKFDKDKWVASLPSEQKTLLKLEIDTLDPTWLAQLKDEITSSSFLDLKRFLQKEVDSGKKIFPPLEEVYSWYVPPT
jgi:uracil-DNA glycosylase